MSTPAAPTATPRIVIERTPDAWTVTASGRVLAYFETALTAPQVIGGLARRLEARGYRVLMRRAEEPVAAAMAEVERAWEGRG